MKHFYTIPLSGAETDYLNGNIETIRDEYLSRNKNPDLIEQYDEEIEHDCKEVAGNFRDMYYQRMPDLEMDQLAITLKEAVLEWKEIGKELTFLKAGGKNENN
jgi:hypothetical protein